MVTGSFFLQLAIVEHFVLYAEFLTLDYGYSFGGLNNNNNIIKIDRSK
jgi:hypothetical protein